MPAGLEVYRQNGTVKFSLNNRPYNFLGVFETGKSNGSFTVYGLTSGSNLNWFEKPLASFNDRIPTFSRSGKARFMIADVTDLASTNAPSNPNAPVVNVNATERRVEVTGPTQNTISPQVSLSISGGTAPYSIQWEFVGGSQTVGAYGSTTGTTFSTVVYNQTPDTTHQAVWRARVVSASNVVSYSPEVTFTHVMGAWSEDYTPDTITNWPAINGSVTARNYEWSTSWYGEHFVTGINRNITVRFEAYDVTGNLDGLVANVFTMEPGTSTWDHRGMFNCLVAGPDGLRKLDIANIKPGTRIAINPTATSAGGQKTGSVRFALWSLSSNTQFASATSTFTVDVPDTTLDAIPGAALSLYTNEATGWTNTLAFTVSGINRAVVLRFTRGNQYDEGGSFTRRLFIYHSTNNGASWNEHFIGAGPQGIADITVNNGDLIHTRAYFDTGGGRGYSSFTAYIANQTTGGNQIASFSVAGTTDADDNYVAPIAFPNLNFNTTADYGAVSHNFTISRSIRVRVTISNLTRNMQDGYLYLARQSDGHQFGKQHYALVGTGEGSFEADIPAGTGCYWYFDGNTNSGVRSATFDVKMENLSNGGVIGQFSCGGVVDSDNNFNVTVDYDPDPISFATVSAYVSNEFETSVSANSQTYYLTGFAAAATFRVYLGIQSHNFEQYSNGQVQVGDGATSGSIYCNVLRNGNVVATLQHFLWGNFNGAEFYDYADLVFSPGDSVSFQFGMSGDLQTYNAGLNAATYGGVYFDRIGGARVGSFVHNLQVQKTPQGGWGGGGGGPVIVS